MSLSLRFQSTGPLPGGRETIRMAGGSLTIGRGQENDLELPDPDRTISKRHCFLEERGGDYILIDLSTNGTFLNYGTERLGDVPTPLNDGDVISVGPYELVVEIGSGSAAVADDPFADIAPPLGEEQVSPGRAADDGAKQDFVGTLDDPAGTDGDGALDDLLGSESASAAGPGQRSWQNAVIPDDPLGDPDPGLPEGEDPFALGPAPDLFREGGASEADHAPAEQGHFAPQTAHYANIPDDWDEEFGGPEPPPAATPEEPFTASRTAPDEQLEVPPADPAPEPQAAAPVADPRPAPVARKPVQGASAAPPEDAAAVRCFLEAAGAESLQIPDEELPDVMARLGAVFRIMVEGMREVLMTRASIKGEFRMSQTMIRSGGNNPLKFSISPEQAVKAMILPADRGYQDAETAAREALQDIKAHEVAMMTGMQAALAQVLTRLDPARLAERIEGGGGRAGLFKAGRKARYWEAYEKMYADFARETEDDFHAAFGKAFARAYEEQLRKL